MASEKEKITKPAANTKGRMIAVITAVLMIVMIAIGYYKFYSGSIYSVAGGSFSGGPGSIQSIPGALNPTAQYAKLQEQQNVEKAESAQKQGSSSIPTIVRSQSFGEGVEAVGPQGGKGGLGFSEIERLNLGGAQQSLWLQDLVAGNCSAAAIKKAVSLGAGLQDLRKACSCDQLKKNGYTLNELDKFCSCPDLKAAGFSAAELKQKGYSASVLVHCGFDACELRAAGFSAAELKKAGLSDGELKGAGFTKAEIAAAGGVPPGMSESAIRAAGCSAAELGKLRDEGVSAAAIRRISGCTLAQLKAAGFSPKELEAAGFTKAELQNAGIIPAGLSPMNIEAAGCEPNKLKALIKEGVSIKKIEEFNHCTAKELAAAGASLGDLLKAGFSKEQARAAEAIDRKDAGQALRDLKNCNVEALKAAREAGVSATGIEEKLHCSAAALKAAGYTDADVRRAVAAEQALQKLVNCDVNSIKAAREAGVGAKAIIEKLHCSAAALKAAGYSDADVKAAEEAAAKDAADALHDLKDCNVAALKNAREAGVSAANIEAKLHCSIAALKAAGYSGAALKQVEAASQALRNLTTCDVQALKAARDAGVSAAAIMEKLHCSSDALKAAGFSDADIKAAEQAAAKMQALQNLTNCSVTALEAARKEGVSAESIVEKLHCSIGALAAAGFSPDALNQAEEAAAEEAARALQNLTNCDVDSLRTARQAGVSAEDILKKLHCSAQALKAAGFTAADLLEAGIPADKLVGIGFSAKEVAAAVEQQNRAQGKGKVLPAADCSVGALQKARMQGVSAATIRDKMGCNLEALKAAGYTAKELREAGYTAAELKGVGFTPSELKNAGYSASDLAAAGFTAQQLKNAGFGLNDLAQAGFDAKDLKQAGFSANAMRAAGYSASELKKAGYTPQQLQDAGYSEGELQRIGINPKEAALTSALESTAPMKNQAPTMKGAPGLGAPPNPFMTPAALASQKQLKEVLRRQKEQMAQQEFQQQIQAKVGQLTTAAMQAMQNWKGGYTQAYVSGNVGVEAAGSAEAGAKGAGRFGEKGAVSSSEKPSGPPTIRAGEVMFAVLDTSVDSDEPGPILATIVAGRFKGAKLIGSFHLPPNADKLVIDFNTLSPSGAERTTPISAYAIDPNTARTALASSVNHHYLLRYGSLFASTWLEGFGNAIQSANTTITIGGTGVAQATTIQNGVGRSTLENAVIGLATLGKTWGQVAMEKVNTPATVRLCSGVGIGVLFSQDVDVK